MIPHDQWPAWEQVGGTPSEVASNALYEAKLELVKAQFAAELARQAAEAQAAIVRRQTQDNLNAERVKAASAHDYAMVLAVHNAYLEVGKKLLDRDTSRAEFVQKAAGLISTAYAALLALRFGTDVSKGAIALPLTALAPTLFLAIAILWSTAFLSFITNPGSMPPPQYSGNNFTDQEISRNAFILWARAGGLRRAWMLQGAVLSLAFGIILLPAPYIKDQDAIWLLRALLIGIGVVVVVMVASWWRTSTRMQYE